MKKIIIGAVAIAAMGGVAWYAYKKEAVPADGFLLSASMACADGTYFIAEFPSPDKVDIVVDGEAMRTLPLVSGAGQRFEDADYVYVFAGEEATVTAKATGAVTTCGQPMDPNNAPVNFGDEGEGAGTKPDMARIVGESIIGKWQSADDAKFVREFKAGGAVADWYDGKLVSNGTMAVSEKDGATYVTLTMSGTQAENLHFKLAKLTPEELELVYMDRGGVLRFTAVK